jgi:arylsulfatase
MATCVDISGAKYPSAVDGQAIKPMEGRSLKPLFTSGGRIEREAIYWEHEGNRAVRAGDWKLVAKGRKGKWELYNMANDRTELHDLAEQEPSRVAELAAMWNRYAERTNVLPWPAENEKKGKHKK